VAKRKKIKKAGSTTRNIHKIAATLGVIPLVASSFLFTDSYALASGSTPVAYPMQNKTIDLGRDNQLTISMYDLFKSDTIFENMFTGSIVVSESSDPLTTVDTSSAFQNAYFSCGDLILQANHLGSYTVTVQATNYGTPENDVVEATFTVGIIDHAILKDKLDQLDGKHNGLDITDVVNAVNKVGLSTEFDTNGNHVIDKGDYAEYLSLIPAAFTNHSPVLRDGTIPSISLDIDESKSIDLNTYFKDEDEESYIRYRLYDAGSELFYANISSSYLYLSAAESIGSSPITIVADDNDGGSKVVEFTINVFDNHSPELNETSPLYDLIMETGTSFHKT
jgi:hypothetical protein